MNSIRNIWYGLSIRTKLMMFFSVIIICISFLNLYTLSNAYRYMDIYEEDLKKTSRIHDLETLIVQCSTAFEEALASTGSESLKTYNDSIPGVWSAWNEVWETSIGNQEAIYQISAIRYAFLAYNSTVQAILKYRNTSEKEFISSLLKSRRIIGYMDNYLKELVSIRLGEGSRLHSVHVKKVNTIRMVSFLGVGVIVVLLLFFGILFSESVTRPIRQLALRSSRMAKGKLTSKEVPVPYKDEIGVLTRSFNQMNRNIHEMVKSLEDKVEIEKRLREDEVKIVEMNRSLRESQFLSLQSQINPHFLFNTLNTISRTSMFEKAPETVKLIECLSSVFRYTLNEQNRIVSLAEEIHILEKYMYIQKSRYGDRIRYETDFSIPLSEIKIPIFTLQPLVENTIKYGIEPMEKGGAITLSVGAEKGRIIIRLTDTGIGMSEESLERILHSEEKTASIQSTGIGISNVRKRLNLAFQGRESFNIASRQGEGTTITISIPENEPCIEY